MNGVRVRRNVRQWGMAHKNGAAIVSILHTVVIGESQQCGLRAFTTEPKANNGAGVRCIFKRRVIHNRESMQSAWQLPPSQLRIVHSCQA